MPILGECQWCGEHIRTDTDFIEVDERMFHDSCFYEMDAEDLADCLRLEVKRKNIGKYEYKEEIRMAEGDMLCDNARCEIA